jgi:predicted DCC family thiol-disulfide oxidoreductase YuxK
VKLYEGIYRRASAMTPILLFDGDCSFCSSSARVLKKIVGQKVEVLAYQHVDLEPLGILTTECELAVQFVAGNLRSSGHIAIADALIATKSIWSLAGHFIKLPVITSAGFLVYEWVSKNRHKLPGGTPACQMPPPKDQA